MQQNMKRIRSIKLIRGWPFLNELTTKNISVIIGGTILKVMHDNWY